MRVSNIKQAIAQARANADLFKATYYVNSASDGIRVERTPVTRRWAGNRTITIVEPLGAHGIIRRLSDGQGKEI